MIGSNEIAGKERYSDFLTSGAKAQANNRAIECKPKGSPTSGGSFSEIGRLAPCYVSLRKMPHYRFAFVLLAILLSSVYSFAHPMGNFSISHESKIILERDWIEI